jgi:hypothetical protein
LWSKAESDHHYSPFFDKALKLMNLQQVAFEIENSVMSKMSCTACKGKNTKNLHQNHNLINFSLISWRNTSPTLHKIWKEQRRNHQDHLPVLHEPSNSIGASL